jgi:hypothetical protein
LGISRYELPAVHPEEAEGAASKAVDRDTSAEVAVPEAAADESFALSTPFGADLDDGWDDQPASAHEDRASSAILRLDDPLDEPAAAPPRVTGPAAPTPAAADEDEDDFGDFEDPSHPPARAAPPPVAAAAPELAAVEPQDNVVHLSPRAVVVCTLGPAELRRLPLDPQIMFVLTQLDGVTDLDTVLEMTGVPADAALDALDELAQKGIVIRIA